MTFQVCRTTVLFTKQIIVIVGKIHYFPLQSAVHAVWCLSPPLSMSVSTVHGSTVNTTKVCTETLQDVATVPPQTF